MSITSNKIGIHQFISLKGQIIAPKQMKVVVDRYGVDGSEFKLAGKKGQPFQLASEVDCESYEDAEATLNAYRQLIEEGSVSLTRAGVDFDEFGFRVSVLSVDGTPVTLAGGVGQGFSSARQGYLFATWTLIGVTIDS